MKRRHLAPIALALLAAPACFSIASTARHTLDPVVTVHGASGDELAVSTDYGVVFLGRTAQSGRVAFTAWFGDGAAREEGVVESVGGGLYATSCEITLPSVPLCFDPPPPGSEVLVRTRRGREVLDVEAVLAADARVTGILLERNGDLDDFTDADLGAAVLVVRSGEPVRLLGLLSGRLEFTDGRRYATVVGPEDLWRLVVHKRNANRPRRWVYRDDL